LVFEIPEVLDLSNKKSWFSHVSTIYHSIFQHSITSKETCYDTSRLVYVFVELQNSSTTTMFQNTSMEISSLVHGHDHVLIFTIGKLKEKFGDF